MFQLTATRTRVDSRVANSLYWMSRYIERAENIARLLDVNLQLLLDFRNLDDHALDAHWIPVVQSSGDEELFRRLHPRTTGQTVTQFLVFQIENPNSIVSSIGQARENAIIEAARALNDLDIDLLKLEYPGSPEGCRRLAAILDRPWAVLSAGVPFEQFTDIIRIATDEGGASGFIAGRSVWREVVSLVGPQRQEFLESVALPRLERLVGVAEHSARPWTGISRQPRATSPN